MPVQPMQNLPESLGATIDWDDVLTEAQLTKTADGVVFKLRFKLRTSPKTDSRESGPRLLTLLNLRALLRIPTDQIELGSGSLDGAESLQLSAGYRELSVGVRLSDAALAKFEDLRGGAEPRFDLLLHGDLVMQRGDGVWEGPVMRIIEMLPIRVVGEAWAPALAKIGASSSILVDIPLAQPPLPGWEDLYLCFVDAHAAFERGGVIGWKTCGANIRDALDRWPEPRTSAGKEMRNLFVQRKDWTLEERVEVLREALRNVTHAAHHRNEADAWTRDDAVLLLTATAALIKRECG